MGKARQSASTKLRAKLSAAVHANKQKAQDLHILNVELRVKLRRVDERVAEEVHGATHGYRRHIANLTGWLKRTQADASTTHCQLENEYARCERLQAQVKELKWVAGALLLGIVTVGVLAITLL